MVIRRVAPMSVAKIAGVLYAVIGLVVGAFISLAALVGGIANRSSEGAAVGAVFGIGAVILAPIFYGALGFVTTLVMAALYNAVAGWVGGIEVDIS